MPSDAHSFALPFLYKEQLTADVYSFYFDREAYAFDFLPGQYLRMILPHEDPDTRGTSRFFTIASPPTDHETVMITTKLVQSTFKQALHTLLPGQEVQFWGPLGTFVLDEAETRPLAFLAGGVGITPYYSIMTYARDKKLTMPMTLFAAFSSQEELIFFDELSAISNAQPNLRVVYTITHPLESPSSWNGETGRFSAVLLQKYLSEPADYVFYTSGPGALVDAVEQLLLGLHIPAEHIHLETYPGY